MSAATVNLSDPAQLTSVLRMLSEPDTEVIRRAEKLLSKWIKDPIAISSLINQITTCEDPNIRHHASLLLKKKINMLFSKLNREQQNELKTLLLQIIVNEPVKVVSTALAGVVACLSKYVLSNGVWPELFNLLMHLAQHPRENLRSLCYNLIGQLAEHVAIHLKAHTATLEHLFIMGCKDTAKSVAMEALASTAAYISAVSEHPEVMQLHGVIRPMLEVMASCLQSGNEEIVAEGLDVIQECCVIEHPLINDHIEAIVPFVIEIMQSSSYEDQVKQAAGQTLMNIIEYRPKLVSKKNLVTPILSSLVDMIAKSDSMTGALFSTAQHNHLNVDDDDDDEDYTSEVEVQHLAQTCLDTMAISIPSKHFSQPALNMCADCLNSTDAHRRKAGCAVLGVIAEGCRDIIKETLAQILPRLLTSVQDPEYFVRESACFALGQFSEHCQPEILYYHQTVLPVVFTALEDPRPTVQGTSCYVLEMFCENLQPDTLRPFLPLLVNKFSQLLLSPQKNTQEMCLAAVAATAVAAEIDFLPYTEGICSIIAPLIFDAEPLNFSVRGRALECLGHIAVAIGRDHFLRYFDSGMQSAKQGLELNDVNLKEYSYVFIANCAKVMTRSFDPFLPQLVPYLLEVITENELYTGGPEEDDENYKDEEDLDDDDDEGGGGEYRINVNDGFVNSKKAAITALGTLAEHTKEAFFPYLEETINCFVTTEMGAMNSFHGIVRAEAITVFEHLVGVACAKFGPNVQPPKGQLIPLNDLVAQVVKVSLGAYVDTMMEDTERKPVGAACEGLCGVLNLVGVAALAIVHDNGRPFAEPIMNCIKMLLAEKAKCQTASQFEDDDDEDGDHDNVVMDSVSDLIGDLAKNIGPQFEHYFSEFHPLLIKFTKSTRPYTDRSMAIGVYAEVIAEIGPLALKYAEALLPIIQVGLTDPMEGVRRNSAFFIGVLVDSTGTALADKWPTLLQWLYPLCTRSDGQLSSDMGGADIDNAISAVARMIGIAQARLPLGQVLPVMIKSLPLRSDHTEGPNIYGCLSNLLVAGDPSALSLLPQILSAFAQVFTPGSKATDETKVVIKSCVSHLASSAMHQQLFHSALAQCEGEIPQIIENIVRM